MATTTAVTSHGLTAGTIAGFNEALKKSQELAAGRLGALTGGMKIPGLM